MRKHEENDCVRVLTNKCHLAIDGRTKTIRGSKSQVIGNKAWGRIDFLTNYRGYVFFLDNTVISKDTKPEVKKEVKKTKKTLKKVREEKDVKSFKKR